MIPMALILSKCKLGLTWLKANSFSVLLFIGIVSLIVFNIMTRNKDRRLIEALQKNLEESRKNYEKAKQLHQNEILKRQEMEQRYQRTIAELKAQYQIDISKLDSDKRRMVNQIIAETNNNTSEIAARINRDLGIRMYEDIH